MGSLADWSLRRRRIESSLPARHCPLYPSTTAVRNYFWLRAEPMPALIYPVQSSRWPNNEARSLGSVVGVWTLGGLCRMFVVGLGPGRSLLLNRNRLQDRWTRARVNVSAGWTWSRLGLELVDSAVSRTCLFVEVNTMNRWRKGSVVAGANPPTARRPRKQRCYVDGVGFQIPDTSELGPWSLDGEWVHAKYLVAKCWCSGFRMRLCKTAPTIRSSVVISTPPQR